MRVDKSWKYKIRKELDATLLNIEKCRFLMKQYPELKLKKIYDDLLVKADLLTEELKKFI